MGAIKRSERPEVVETTMNRAEQMLYDKIWLFRGEKDEFMKMRQEALRDYDELTEEEKESIDESMIMEHLSMLHSCYVDD